MQCQTSTVRTIVKGHSLRESEPSASIFSAYRYAAINFRLYTLQFYHELSAPVLMNPLRKAVFLLFVLGLTACQTTAPDRTDTVPVPDSSTRTSSSFDARMEQSETSFIAGSEWEVVNLGPAVNTVYTERLSMISDDGLSLYFASDRPESLGDTTAGGEKPWDIYVARRSDVDEPFGEAVNLGQGINSPYSDHSPAFTPDGHWMYFVSDRPGGCGSGDLYVAYREDPSNDLGWEEPRHLGCALNTSADESCPFYHVDEETGRVTLYLVSNRAEDPSNYDIFASTIDEQTESWRPAEPLANLSSAAFDGHFEPYHGLIWSERKGGYGKGDIWRVPNNRETGNSQATNIGAPINSEHDEGLPSVSSDGRLYFPSDRPGGYGGYDIYVAVRKSE